MKTHVVKVSPSSMRIGIALSLLALVCSAATWGHGIHGPDREFIENNAGMNLAAFMYLGAKHMITGYDHLLYLAGVVFFLGNFRDVVRLVSLFAIGHSITLLYGVLAGVDVNPYLVDALIGFSVVYKAIENLSGDNTLPLLPSVPLAVFLFGLIHGFGLASKLQEFTITPDGLIGNIVSFNLGVEIGQVVALCIIFLVFKLLTGWRRFKAFSILANWMLFVAGLVLIGYQLTAYYYA